MNVATSPLTGPQAPCTKDEEPARLINLFTPELPVHPADTQHSSPCSRQGPRLPRALQQKDPFAPNLMALS